MTSFADMQIHPVTQQPCRKLELTADGFRERAMCLEWERRTVELILIGGAPKGWFWMGDAYVHIIGIDVPTYT